MPAIRTGVYVTLQQQIDSAVATGSELVDNIWQVYRQTIADLPFNDDHRQTAKPTVSHWRSQMWLHMLKPQAILAQEQSTQ